MEIFHYEAGQSPQNNFFRWFDMNTVEKRLYNEEPYTVDQATEVFNKLHGKKFKQV